MHNDVILRVSAARTSHVSHAAQLRQLSKGLRKGGYGETT